MRSKLAAVEAWAECPRIYPFAGRAFMGDRALTVPTTPNILPLKPDAIGPWVTAPRRWIDLCHGAGRGDRLERLRATTHGAIRETDAGWLAQGA